MPKIEVENEEKLNWEAFERRKEFYNEEGLKELLEDKKKDEQEWDKKIKDFEKELKVLKDLEVDRPND